MILIVGCGRLGGSLATRLAAAGEEVVVLDHDRRNFEMNLPKHYQGVRCEGMEIDNDVLRRAEIERADAVAALARDESTNMMVADVARKIFRVSRIVVRIDDPRMAALYRSEGFEVVSPVSDTAVALEQALGGRAG
ncbi:MAG: NAD-binding protein [Candidatus Sericytochromatia bacterium]|nr:NAD-binding protein [Candidatus Sericytochromatia bacterium]